MKKKIVLRVDGNNDIGLGHVMRCMALAQMLCNDFDCIFAIQQPAPVILDLLKEVDSEIIALPKTQKISPNEINYYYKRADIIITDGYYFDSEYQKQIKLLEKQLICIDDIHAFHFYADAIINHAVGVNKSLYSAESYTKFLFGADYILLRKQFLHKKERKKEIETVSNVLISMGGADIENNTQKVLDALLNLNTISKINILIGAVNKNKESINKFIKINELTKKATLHYNVEADEVCKLIRNSDLTICPASTTAIEACAIGTPIVSGLTADNQESILNGLVNHSCMISIGNFNDLTSESLKNKLNPIIEDVPRLNELIINQNKLIDGKSQERYKQFFHELVNT